MKENDKEQKDDPGRNSVTLNTLPGKRQWRDACRAQAHPRTYAQWSRRKAPFLGGKDSPLCTTPLCTRAGKHFPPPRWEGLGRTRSGQEER